jgi:hypothetical protein
MKATAMSISKARKSLPRSLKALAAVGIVAPS